MRSNQLQPPSYMEMRIDLDGKQSALFLRIPTFWDDVNKLWIGAIKLSNGKLLMAKGKTSFDLQNNFNRVFEKGLRSEDSKELFDMFKPLEYWEKA